MDSRVLALFRGWPRRWRRTGDALCPKIVGPTTSPPDPVGYSTAVRPEPRERNLPRRPFPRSEATIRSTEPVSLTLTISYAFWVIRLSAQLHPRTAPVAWLSRQKSRSVVMPNCGSFSPARNWAAPLIVMP
jgi:hypothetical protein